MRKLGIRILTFILTLCMLVGFVPIITPQVEAVNNDFTEGWLWPVLTKQYYINSPYNVGYANLQRKRGGKPHSGIDIYSDITDEKKEIGEPVVASRDGEVFYVKNTGRHGGQGDVCCVILKHTIGGEIYYSGYWHLAKGSIKYYNGAKAGEEIKLGDIISQGEQIGLAGNTGESDGVHLHFTIGTRVWYAKAYSIWTVTDKINVNPRDNSLVHARPTSKYTDKEICTGGMINYVKDTHTHTYTDEKKPNYCTATGCSYQLPYDYQFDSGCAGTYKVKSGKTAYVRDAPYQLPNNDIDIYSSENIRIEIVGSVINSYTNKWYKTEDGYYIYEENIEPATSTTSAVTCSGTNTASGSLAMHSTQDFENSSKNGSIPAGATVTVNPKGTGVKGMLNVTYNGTTGYVSGNYINLTAVDRSTKLKIPNTTITIQKGKNPTGGFTISSNKNITYIHAKLDGKNLIYMNPNSRQVQLSGNKIFSDAKWSSLSVGTHTLSLTAMDAGGSVVKKDITVKVTAATSTTQVKAPSISYEDVEGGKRVTIRQNSSGTTLYYYWYDCDGVNRSTTDASVSFTLEYSDTVAAYSQSGNTYARTSLYIPVEQINTPVISFSQHSGGATVTISGNDKASVYYSINGGTERPYVGSFTVTESCTITARAERLGYRDSETASASVTVSAPAKPVISPFQSETVLAQGKAVTVRWEKDPLAASYTARLYKDGTVVETKAVSGQTATFTLSELGEYKITVQASNFMGNSDESTAVSFATKAPVTVRFVDHDGTLINEQTVSWGESATRPTAPSRRGYTFDGWDGSYSNVTSDTTVTAAYTKNYYTVNFYDVDGSTLIDSQSVAFGDAADCTYAATQVSLNAGYILAGWRIEEADEDSTLNMNEVDSDMEIVAVSRWENADLPVVTSIQSAVWNSGGTGYDITLTLDVADEATLKEKTKVIKIVAALKTSEDKLLGLEIHTVNVSSSTVSGSYSMFIACGASAMADQVGVHVLGAEGNGRTGTVLAAASYAAPTRSEEGAYWSEWSTTKPVGVDESLIQTKTQYRYRDNSKSTNSVTSSSATPPTLDGWTYSGSSWTWGSTVDNGYNYVASSDTRNVWTQQDLQTAGYYLYQYYSYRAKKGSSSGYNFHYCIDIAKSNHPSWSYSLYSSGWITYQYSHSKTYTHNCSDCSSASPKGTIYVYPVPNASNPTAYYYWYETKYVEPTYKTHYYYQDKVFTHNYYKWDYGNWSDWTDTVYTATSVRDVETRTLYRYVTNTATEDTSGTMRTVSGSLDASLGDLFGKNATVMVYKERNADPTQEQMEYVGHITLGEGNSYEFSFKTLEEPTEQTGDFVVALALEGTSNLIKVAVIEAPVPEYTVTFYAMDNVTVIDTQTVRRGKNAVIPEAPEIEGYTFIKWSEKWSGTSTNIRRNQSYTAEYQANTYAVAYVDWTQDTIELTTAKYGEMLNPPTPEPLEGYTFLGWDKLMEGSAAVCENTIVTAVYEANTYTVCFHDENNEVIDTQTVSYGQSARLPEDLSPEGMIFLGWDTNAQWWNVKENLDVFPIVIYEESANLPGSSLGYECYGQELSLELTAQEDATIYYTTDGSDPTEASTEYTGQIELTDTVLLRAIAVLPEKNASEIMEVYFENTENTYYDDVYEAAEISALQIETAAEQETILRVDAKGVTPLTSYQFVLECDRSIFYVAQDENGEYCYEPGMACPNGTLYCAPCDAGWLITWLGDEASTETGTLFTITLKAAASAETGTYPVKVSYVPMGTLTQSGESPAEAPTCFLPALVEEAVTYTYKSNSDKTHKKIGSDGSTVVEDCSFIDSVVEPTVTQFGYTLHVCECCAYQYRSDSVIPLGPGDSLKFKQATITLESDISINFYILDSVMQGWGDSWVMFMKTLYDADGNETGKQSKMVRDYVLEELSDGKVYRVYTFTGINAAEMGSTISAHPYVQQGSATYAGKSVTYSVLRYATNMLSKTADDSLKTLLVDLLNYGAAAQSYFGYNTANLVNANLTEEQRSYATTQAPALTSCRKLVKNEEATVSFKSCYLALEQKVTINYTLNLTSYTGEVNDLVLKVAYQDTNGNETMAEIDSTEFAEEVYDGVTYYTANFSNLNAIQMRTICKAEVFSKTTGERLSDTVIYSIESYAYSKSADADTKLVGLVTAMMKYGDATEAYFMK